MLSPPLRPSLRRALIAITAASLVAFWGALVLDADARLVTHWAYAVLLVVPTLVVIARAAGERHDRAAWITLALGLGLWTFGSVWQVILDLRGGSLGFPSFGDALWLAMYPLVLASYGFIARTRLRRPPLTLMLDALMVTTIVAAVAMAPVLPAVIDNDAHLSVVAQLVNFFYPLSDSLLISVAVTGAVLVGWREGKTWALIAAGAVALVIGDLFWAMEASSGDWRPLMAAHAFYPLWPIFLAAAALRPRSSRASVHIEESDVRVLGSVIAAAVAAIGLLVANEWLSVPGPSVFLAGAALLAAVNRTVLALTEGVRTARAEARSRAVLEDVRNALLDDELTVHFQPLICARTDAVVSAEALLRWPRDGGFVPPGDFLGLVERSELMGPLTDFVLDRALASLRGWRAGGHDIGVSVNLAAANLCDEDLPRRVALALARHGVPAAALTLELTETDTVQEPEAADRVLAALHALGLELSIDDFGTGHSNLARVARFPIGEIKIDRSFVSAMTSAERPIVATMIQLAHTLGLRVVAEGIEDAETLAALRTMGCDLAQGFHIARPLPPEALEAWLAGRSHAALSAA